jgi:hypothetical protein
MAVIKIKTCPRLLWVWVCMCEQNTKGHVECCECVGVERGCAGRSLQVGRIRSQGRTHGRVRCGFDGDEEERRESFGGRRENNFERGFIRFSFPARYRASIISRRCCLDLLKDNSQQSRGREQASLHPHLCLFFLGPFVDVGLWTRRSFAVPLLFFSSLRTPLRFNNLSPLFHPLFSFCILNHK